MPFALATAALWVVSAAQAQFPPQPACMPAPDAPACESFTPQKVREVFDNAMKSYGLDPLPRIVLAADKEFVRFDCAAGRAVAGGSNAETQECAGGPVITVGGSVLDMSIACPALGVTPEQTLEAWALHEGAHVKHKHVRCRAVEVQRTCIAWADEEDGRRTVARLLKRQGAESIKQLSPQGTARFRTEYIDACLKVKRQQFDASAVAQEDQADAEASARAKPRAMECAMQGAAVYLRVRGLEQEQDSGHAALTERLLNAETASAEHEALPKSLLPADAGAAFSGQ